MVQIVEVSLFVVCVLKLTNFEHLLFLFVNVRTLSFLYLLELSDENFLCSGGTYIMMMHGLLVTQGAWHHSEFGLQCVGTAGCFL